MTISASALGNSDPDLLVREATEQKGRLSLTHLSRSLLTYFCLTLICSVQLDTVVNALLLSDVSVKPGTLNTHVTQADGWMDRWLVFHLPLSCNPITRKRFNFKNTEQLFETRYDAKAAGLNSLLPGSLIRKWPRWPPFKWVLAVAWQLAQGHD